MTPLDELTFVAATLPQDEIVRLVRIAKRAANHIQVAQSLRRPKEVASKSNHRSSSMAT